MSIPSVGAKGLLVAAGVGSDTPTDDWGIHISQLPAMPIKAIAIYDTGGTGEGPNPKWLLDYRTIQVMVRGSSNGYEEAYGKAQAVKDTLLGLPAQVVGDDRWDGVTGVGDITFVARNENNQPMIAINFRIIIEPGVNLLTNREPL
jgi:hypothetical protein